MWGIVDVKTVKFVALIVHSHPVEFIIKSIHSINRIARRLKSMTPNLAR